MKYRNKIFTCICSMMLAATFAGAQMIDLRPYYNFMLKDGFTLIFEGETEGFEEDDEGEALLVDASWVYQTRIRSVSGGVTESIQRVVTNIPTPDGTALLIIDGLLTIDDEGVVYQRTDGITFFFGDVFTVQVINRGDPLFLPASAELGTTFETTYERETSMSLGFGDSIAEVRRETTIAAIETITVPAGTFEALRVEEVETVEMVFFGITIESIDKTTLWFAPDVGLIRIEEREMESFGGILPGEEKVNSLFELVAYHESFELDSVESVFFAAGTLQYGDLEYFWQPWLGFFLRVSESSGWIYHPGFGFVVSLGSSGLNGRWMFSPDPRLGSFYLDDRCLTYEDLYDEATDEFTTLLRGWFYRMNGGGAWYYFEADILNAKLRFWREGAPPVTEIEFAPIFDPDEF